MIKDKIKVEIENNPLDLSIIKTFPVKKTEKNKM